VQRRRLAIDWIMRSQKVSFLHACELLAKQHPAVAGSEAGAESHARLSVGAEGVQGRRGAALGAIARVKAVKQMSHSTRITVARFRNETATELRLYLEMTVRRS